MVFVQMGQRGFTRKNKLHLKAYVSKIVCAKMYLQLKLNCSPLHMAHVIAQAIGVIIGANFAPVISANCHPNL